MSGASPASAAGAPLLFVYGTLRSDAGHPMRGVLAAGGEYLGPAATRGTLLVVDWYPGLVLEPPGRVVGELWRLRVAQLGFAERRAAASARRASWRLAAEVLGLLDAYEGCHARDPPPHEYARREVEVSSEGEARPIRAWTYVYTGDRAGLRVVTSGDWLCRRDGP